MNSDILKNKFLSGDCATRTIFKMGDDCIYTETIQPGNFSGRYIEKGAYVKNAQFTDDFGNKMGKNGQVKEIISRQVFIENQWLDV